MRNNIPNLADALQNVDDTLEEPHMKARHLQIDVAKMTGAVGPVFTASLAVCILDRGSLDNCNFWSIS